MGSLKTGGGTSAVASSAHAGCERYRHTDPMIVPKNRREIAKLLGKPDTSAGIPDARWVRAMTFERLVHHENFVSQLLTTAVGALHLDRPDGIRRADGKINTADTASAIQQAHTNALAGEATMITGLAVPFAGLEDESATNVKPDFAIVIRKNGSDGTWLIMGDAKDYERVRSRIDDGRLLKGFLQVALGAESAERWSALPDGMQVHSWGALAVPRNAFLQPQAVVERLDDHREEVRTRAQERLDLLKEGTKPTEDELLDYVTHLQATYDPASCPSCTFFNFCRDEIRQSTDPADRLVEIGIRPERRTALAPLLSDTSASVNAPPSVVANVKATLTGLPAPTGRRRFDLAGEPGTINVVLAKSDAAALGVHGIAIQRVGAGPWVTHTFDDPQSPATRAHVMHLLGEQLQAAIEETNPVSLVLPDAPTGDLLVSIADSLAGVETSRLRWQRDLEVGRAALTFDGEPAMVPAPLTETQRLAVSFLLEEDRARSITLRFPLINLRDTLSSYLIAGGPTFEAGRLDYLVRWAEANAPLNHQDVSDDIAGSAQTPGARLANETSNRINAARRRDPAEYVRLVTAEIAYKTEVFDRALAALAARPVSTMRPIYQAIEADAQTVWRARLALHASDLVRFGRTSRNWRNNQVPLRETDLDCSDRLTALGNPSAAHDLAADAGTAKVTLATVTNAAPIRLRFHSPRFKPGMAVVALHVNGSPCVEDATVTVQKGSFKFADLSMGELFETDGDDLRWRPAVHIKLNVGDEVIVADTSWFEPAKNNKAFTVDRPARDTDFAPKETCTADSYKNDSDNHRWCCRSHEDAEAEYADVLAERRERGELNPQVWPPVVDTDAFDTPAAGSPTGDDEADKVPVPANLTLDDID